MRRFFFRFHTGSKSSAMLPVGICLLRLLCPEKAGAQETKSCTFNISITTVGVGPFARVGDPSFQQKKNLWLVVSGNKGTIAAFKLPTMRLGLPQEEYAVWLVQSKKGIVRDGRVMRLAKDAIVLSREEGITCVPPEPRSVVLAVNAAGPK